MQVARASCTALALWLIAAAQPALLEEAAARSLPFLQQAATDAAAQSKEDDLAKRVDALYAEGRFEEALALAKEGLALSEKLHGPEHVNVADWLSWIAAIQSAQGRFAEAEASLERALAIFEKTLGPTHLTTAQTLTELAGIYRVQGRLDEAEPLLVRALSIVEKAPEPDHVLTAFVLDVFAGLRADQGRFADAEALYKRALGVAENNLGPEHKATGVALTSLGVFYLHQRRIADAVPVLERALAFTERVLGPEHPNTATALNNLASVYLFQHRFADAERLNRRALAIRERKFGPDSAPVASSLANLASLFHQQGRYAEAEALFAKALAIFEKSLGPNHMSMAITLANLADTYTEQGRFADAEGLFARALGAVEKLRGPSHPDTADIVHRLAVFFHLQERFGEAEPLFKRALAIWQAAFGAESQTAAIGLNNLAECYSAQERFAEAEPLMRRSLAIREKVLGPAHPETSASLHNLAMLAKKLGRHAEALPLLKRALPGFEKTFGADHPDTAMVMANLAETYQSLGQLAEAEPLFERSLAALKKVLPADHPKIGWAHHDLSRLQFARGKIEASFASAGHATKILADRAAQQAASRLQGALRAAPSYDAVFEQRVRTAYALARRKPRQEPTLLAAAFEAARQIGADDTARAIARTASRFAADNDALARLLREQRDLLARLPALDRLIANALGSDDPTTRAQGAVFRKEIETTVARLKEIDATLRRDHKAYGEFADPRPLSVGEAQAPLGQDEAAALIIAGDIDTHLVAISKTKIVWARSSLTGADLTREVATLRRQLDPYEWQASMMPFDRAASHRLYRELWAPLDGVVRDKAQVFVVATGPLTSFPLSVLVTEEPKGGSAGDADPAHLRETAWLAKRHALITLPSISSLRALRLFAAKGPATEPFAGFGDPVFADSVAALKVATLPTITGEIALKQSSAARAPLPPSREPVVSPHRTLTPTSFVVPRQTLIVATARTQQLSAFDPASGMHLVGLASAAGTSSLKKASTRSIASVYRGAEPNPDELRKLPRLPATAGELRALAKALGASETDVFLRERATEAQVKALDLSRKRVVAFATHGLMAGEMGLGEPGLVFTPPANATRQDDGYLSASEAARLDLRADWVILSACNTAAGDTPGANGLSGLARAFFLAGAKSLLVSHWTVWDDVAERLTTATVKNFQRHPAQGRAEALRQSMLAVMNDKSAPRYAHPAAWAPFILTGETRAN